MAVQISVAPSRPIDCNTVQIPTGIRIWETSEIYRGLLVSPVPWSPPV